MRGNPDGFLCAPRAGRMGPIDCIARRFARGCSPSGIRKDLFKSLLQATRGVEMDKVAAGVNPAAIAWLVRPTSYPIIR
jgi:hypothetical protein